MQQHAHLRYACSMLTTRFPQDLAFSLPCHGLEKVCRCMGCTLNHRSGLARKPFPNEAQPEQTVWSMLGSDCWASRATRSTESTRGVKS